MSSLVFFKSIYLGFCLPLFIRDLGLFQVPGGPAYNHLEPGDVLVCINGKVSLHSILWDTLPL